jgi:hypothetical protein
MGSSGALGNSENYVLNHQDITNYMGDICHYIDNAWRTPNGAEFGTATDYENVYTSGSFEPTDVSGKASMGTCGVTCYSAYGTVFFPASGIRNGSYGELVAIRDCCLYMSGSVSSGGNFWGLRVEHGGHPVNFTANIAGAYSVRCIKKLPSE